MTFFSHYFHLYWMTVMLMQNRQGGFTVIETLIGIGIFAVVMPAIIVSVVTVADLNDRSADLTRANIVAEEKIESLRSSGYNTLSVGSTTDFTTELDPSFSEPRSATYSVTSPSTGIRQITVDITYTDKSVIRQLQYSSLISELGVAQ